MKPIDSCCFCDIVVGKYRYADIDKPFMSNNEFVAVASIGALVEGWTLIIPKIHRLSMKKIYTHAGFAEIMNSVLSPLIHRYGPLVAFEHGANKEGSITACGTDHAHLHLVPSEESLLREMRKSGLQWIQCRASDVASKSGENEYLFYSELYNNEVWQNPIGYIHVLEHPVSQFFRRLIAARKKMSELSDYKLFPHLDTARQTRKMLVGSTI